MNRPTHVMPSHTAALDDVLRNSIGAESEQETPTETLYRELQAAYTYFNRALFGGELPECLLSLDQSDRREYGYFRANGFTSDAGKRIHQISINPIYFWSRSTEQVLSTLVHEQCHLYIHEFSHARPEGGFHCYAWGHVMRRIGLWPTDNGKRSGNETGYRMSHLIIDGGLFQQACQLLLDHQFAFSWGSTHRPAKAVAKPRDRVEAPAGDLEQTPLIEVPK